MLVLLLCVADTSTMRAVRAHRHSSSITGGNLYRSSITGGNLYRKPSDTGEREGFGLRSETCQVLTNLLRDWQTIMYHLIYYTLGDTVKTSADVLSQYRDCRLNDDIVKRCQGKGVTCDTALIPATLIIPESTGLSFKITISNATKRLLSLGYRAYS